MSKIVIIFGAGASYDLLDVDLHTNIPRWRPPLMKELFDKRFDIVMGGLDLAMMRLPALRQMAKGGENIENFLGELKVLADKDPDIHIELLEIQFFLETLFEYIGKDFLPGGYGAKNTNYFALLRALKDRSVNDLTMITFNYDLFLDNAVESVFDLKFSDLPSYYNQGSVKLLKAHGSINWAYRMGAPAERASIEGSLSRYLFNRTSYGTALKAKALSSIPIEVVGYGVDAESLKVPALAIPVGVDKSFVDTEHVKVATGELKNADFVVIIGWSASDKYFLDMIRMSITPGRTRLLIVSGKGVNEIGKKFNFRDDFGSPLWKDEVLTSDQGFSRLVYNSRLLDLIVG